VPYIDIPLQHISDHVLRDMGRGMGGQETRELMATIRRTVPGVTVRTTFLVGYPGETEADFNELLAYIREYRFDRLGAFAYSPEAGTPAVTAAAGLVSPRAAVARRRRIMEAQQQIALELNRSMIGKTIRVLADAPGKRGEVIGRTAGDAPDVDNLVRIRAPHSLLDRGFVDVNVTAAEPYKLHGTPSVSA
jgi:ribosomal protein S12 methylthiotransferase